ncbi:hypothetical protein [Pseudomonas sp. P9_31]|uniref:antitoxin PaaA2 family protein n=1 Tax=Pseudomonas sp. P9_31 TaxID=3043448 RepID=UPI002A36EC7D|nr:hypothetical protein [Pseudomonas sp. P9_31]WPN57727.1 hypothetical protein QMK51_27025 [Pseudomonas sp. P9_31]
MKSETSDTQQQLEKVACDAWFKAQGRASLDAPRPSIPDEEVTHLMAIKRDKLLKR